MPENEKPLPQSAPAEIYVDKQIYFGITSAVGTPIDLTAHVLEEQLLGRGFRFQDLRLSRLSELLSLPTTKPSLGSEEYRNVKYLMQRGDDARSSSGNNAILAMLAIREAAQQREEEGSSASPIAFLFRQLKHPDEAYKLRQVYDEGFHLVGVHCPRSTRIQQLQVQKGMSAAEANELVNTDEFEGPTHGQRVRDTFHLADVFVRATGDSNDTTAVRTQLSRFAGLLFGDEFHTPTIDEYGMFLAWASGLRSAQMSRQVGAAILTRDGEVLGLGANEVPRAGGGQYWDGASPDGRDHKTPRGDSTDYMKDAILREILDVIDPRWKEGEATFRDQQVRDLRERLDSARIMNLTEFTRATHAEMEAILSASRVGLSVKGATLYTTTFPCHNCTKHILTAGIQRVVYIEPYPKSLAYELHKDAIAIDGSSTEAGAIDKLINFEPFVGIAPRRYADLFAMMTKDGRHLRRKDSAGMPEPRVGLRLRLQVGSYETRENLVAKEVVKITSGSEAEA
jgi:deoxycytidylate deaminase